MFLISSLVILSFGLSDNVNASEILQEEQSDINMVEDNDIISESPMVGLNENGEVIVIPEGNPRLRQAVNGRYIIGNYVLTGQQTQEWAASMENLKGSALLEYMQWGFGGLMGAASGSPVIGAAAQGAFIASKSKVVQKEVINAAAQGQRARIIMYDENPHTSYSVTLKIQGVR